MVAAGDVLASLYSPGLNVTVQNLVDAQRNNSTELLRRARNRLQLLGISDDQIDEILASGKANTHLKIRSPISGHVIKKYIREGQYVDEGMPLYEIVDLSTVWIQAQVYEDDMSFLPLDQSHDPGRLRSRWRHRHRHDPRISQRTVPRQVGVYLSARGQGDADGDRALRTAESRP